MHRGTRGRIGGQPLSAYRLPAGRHGIPPDQVAENQRWRMLGAAAEVLAEHGYARTTSARVASRAHVSSATFYKRFDNVEGCLLASYEMAASCVLELASDACRAPLEEPDRVRVAIDSILDFLACEPVLSRLLGTEAAAGIAGVATARERLIAQLAELLRAGRAGAGSSEEPPARERQLVGGVFALLSDRLVAGEVMTLRELGPELTQILTQAP